MATIFHELSDNPSYMVLLKKVDVLIHTEGALQKAKQNFFLVVCCQISPFYSVYNVQLKYWNNILITETNEISCLGKSFRYCLYKAKGMS